MLTYKISPLKHTLYLKTRIDIGRRNLFIKPSYHVGRCVSESMSEVSIISKTLAIYEALFIETAITNKLCQGISRFLENCVII